MDPGLSRAARHRRDLPAAVAVPRSHRRREHRPGARAGGLWRQIDWRPARRRAAELLARVGASIDPDRLVATLSMPEQQLVEIAKALGADARIVIMDEPTASLTDREVERLFRVIASCCKAHGVGIIYISHRLEEVVRDCRPRHRAARRRDGRDAAPREDVDARRADPDDGRPRALGGLPEARGRARRGRARSARRVASRRPASPTCRSPSRRARSSASPVSSARAARSWRSRSSA